MVVPVIVPAAVVPPVMMVMDDARVPPGGPGVVPARPMHAPVVPAVVPAAAGGTARSADDRPVGMNGPLGSNPIGAVADNRPVGPAIANAGSIRPAVANVRTVDARPIGARSVRPANDRPINRSVRTLRQEVADAGTIRPTGKIRSAWERRSVRPVGANGKLRPNAAEIGPIRPARKRGPIRSSRATRQRWARDFAQARTIATGPIGQVDAGPIDARSIDAGPVDARSLNAGPVDARSVAADVAQVGSVHGGQVGRRTDVRTIAANVAPDVAAADIRSLGQIRPRGPAAAGTDVADIARPRDGRRVGPRWRGRPRYIARAGAAHVRPVDATGSTARSRNPPPPPPPTEGRLPPPPPIFPALPPAAPMPPSDGRASTLATTRHANDNAAPRQKIRRMALLRKLSSTQLR